MMIVMLCILFLSPLINHTHAVMPNFFQHVAQDVVNEEEIADAQGRVERLYQWNVTRDRSLRDNIMALFYPSAG